MPPACRSPLLPLVCLSAICSAAAAMLVLPQVAFALIGGLLFRRDRNTLPPR